LRWCVNGAMKRYKIGEIARLAGVSKRTIDYYTTLGLLRPVRSESNYRYYDGEALVCLKIIESMKNSRFTLEEIKERLSLLNDARRPDPAAGGSGINVELLRRQLIQLEKQLVQLQPGGAAGMNEAQAARLRDKVMLQSVAVFQSLLLYINEINLYL